MPPHPLTNFEIQKFDQNESKFDHVYSTHFDNFGAKYFKKKKKKKLKNLQGNECIITNISRI